MKVLVGCEHSQIVAQEFRKRGHDAYSCDLLETDGDPRHHIQGNVLDYLNEGWDLGIFHPDCTYLTIAAEWAYKDEQTKKIKPGTLIGAKRREAREQAIEFVKQLWAAPIEKKALENPVGVLSTRWREPDQFIQPYEYYEDASKKTCLWLENLPRLVPVKLYPPRLALQKNGKGYAFRWGNQTDSGQNKETPSDDRWKNRSKTFQGWAKAMAEQWG